MDLVKPARHHLAAYCAALRTGWSPNNLRPEAAAEQLSAIARDPDAFLASLDDPQAHGGDVQLPDGSFVARLPSIRLWVWDNGFCGSIGLRWQPGTNALPPTASGHIGYAIVPWRRREGLATAAVRAMLPKARQVGLSAVDVTTDPDNIASIRVIEKAGGMLISRQSRAPALGVGEELLLRIPLDAAP